MTTPFEYAVYHNPYAASIADLMIRQGNVQAAGILQSGDAWSRAAEGIGHAVAGVAGAVAQQQDPRTQIEHAQLDEIKERQAGQKKVDALMAGDQLPQGDVGPRQENFLNSDGKFDVPRMTAALGKMGAGHLAPDLVKGVETINDSITKHQQLEQQLAQQHQIMLGDGAHSVIGLMKLVPDMPADVAIDSVAAPFLATKRFSQQEVDQLKARLQPLPREQQIAALTTLVDQAAQIAPTKVIGKDAQEIDRYGRTIASNIVPEKPTEASLAADAATLGTPQETKTAAQSKRALEALKPPRPRTEAEQAFDAYAKSIGKKQSEDLTDAERQAYIARDAKVKAQQAFAQHKAEHDYDVAHPAAVKGKSQDELEQEARGVLRTEFSSRAGGLGIEDQKVNQAIHLRSLLDQYEGKNMPAQIQAELALGLAKLTSPGGTVGVELEKEFNQRTAEGGVSKAIAWLTGDPTLVNATSEKLREMFRDSIQRQGSVAEQNRQTYLNEMIAMLPTQLEPSRRAAIVASVKPNMLPAPIGSPAEGTQRNGATWKHGPQGWGWYR